MASQEACRSDTLTLPFGLVVAAFVPPFPPILSTRPTAFFGFAVPMSGYAKLFSEIVDSSIWEESNETRIVWITLLALCDCDGYVRGSSGWLAGKAKVTQMACELALEKFKQPDARSRTPDHEGRRIEQLEDGWLVLNYIAFRERLSSDPQAIATRERVRKHRMNVTRRYVTPEALQSVTSPVSASAYASVPDGGYRGEGFKEPTIEEVRLLFAKAGGSETQADMFWHFYNSKGWLVGKTKMKRVGSAVAGWILRNQDNAPVNTNPTNYL